MYTTRRATDATASCPTLRGVDLSTRQAGTPSVHERLENSVVDGRFAPGAKLDLEELAREYACSRTPIREALRQLEASGLVRVVPKRGTFIRAWDAGELAERFEVMAELESMCARLAARRADGADLAAIDAAHAACAARAAVGDVEGYYRDNSVFHARVYRASRNAFLESEARRLHAMLQPYRRMQLRVRDRMDQSLAEHEAVVAALRAGDAAEAARVMGEHVRVQGERFHDLVAALRRGDV